LGKKLIKWDALPGGITKQYCLDQEAKGDLRIIELNWGSVLREAVQFIWISKKKTPNPYKKWGFIIQPWQSPRVYRWLKCERFVFQYQIGYLDVKLIITGLPRPPWRYLPPTRNLIAKKDVF
ncbi:MAG TPA: hypothetical protein VKA34_22360, partial [Balneolales bacterium]|nr:hypothetical protein [Balneolales bacterium]